MWTDLEDTQKLERREIGDCSDMGAGRYSDLGCRIPPTVTPARWPHVQEAEQYTPRLPPSSPEIP